MSFVLVRRTAPQRRALAELDPNKDLNTPRGLSKRDPIVFAEENEAAVYEGLRLGTYDVDEVIALTDWDEWPYSATPRYDESSDDEPAVPVENTFEGGDTSDDEQAGGFREPDDELLGDAMTGDLVEMISEQDDDVDSEDRMHLPLFDPISMGLKEINNLAHFGVSSHKPGNGVSELLSEDLDKYWQ